MSSDTTRAFGLTIKRILISIKMLPIAPAELADDVDIIDDIGLDSIELLNLMLEIEAQLQIQIDFDLLELSTLRSLSTLTAFLETMPLAPASSL
ncbi:MAG: phosphopantetheine-binding protein [Rhodopila sp.]